MKGIKVNRICVIYDLNCTITFVRWSCRRKQKTPPNACNNPLKTMEPSVIPVQSMYVYIASALSQEWLSSMASSLPILSQLVLDDLLDLLNR